MATATPTIVNKKARFEYYLEEEFIAGIVLTGGEVKSLRAGKASLQEAFCFFKKDELFIKKFHIAEYKFATDKEQNPTRERKLLLKNRELKKIHKRVTEKGFTVVPYKVFFSERGFAKVSIYIAKGKKVYDKRETIKQRDQQRNVDRYS